MAPSSLPTATASPLGDEPVRHRPRARVRRSSWPTRNVSRRHAEVRRQGDGFVVVDLGSTNGTKVNGVGVREQRLVDGDEITRRRHAHPLRGQLTVPEPVLTILKFCFLALLYLFFFRVVLRPCG